MKVAKRFAVASTPERVWAFITNPLLSGPCIPGCGDIEVLEAGRYRASIRIALGPIKTTFMLVVDTRVERPPEYAEYVVQGEEGSKASRLNAVNMLTIVPVSDTECEVNYVSEISVTGRLGKFAAGVMQKVAENLGEKFVQALRTGVEAGGAKASQHPYLQEERPFALPGAESPTPTQLNEPSTSDLPVECPPPSQ